MRNLAKGGDKNTRFCHKMANVCSRRNLLTNVRVNATSLFEDDKIKHGVCRAFHSLRWMIGDQVSRD